MRGDWIKRASHKAVDTFIARSRLRVVVLHD